MIANENIGTLLTDLGIRVEAIATALVSRDGGVVHAILPEGSYAETFAVMCATVLGASVTASLELGRAPPVRIVIEGTDATVVIVRAGTGALLVTAIPESVSAPIALAEMMKFAGLLTRS